MSDDRGSEAERERPEAQQHHPNAPHPVAARGRSVTHRTNQSHRRRTPLRPRHGGRARRPYRHVGIALRTASATWSIRIHGAVRARLDGGSDERARSEARDQRQDESELPILEESSHATSSQFPVVTQGAMSGQDGCRPLSKTSARVSARIRGERVRPVQSLVRSIKARPTGEAVKDFFGCMGDVRTNAAPPATPGPERSA